MRICVIAALVTLPLLACTDPENDAAEAMQDISTQQGILLSDAIFTEIHVSEGNVCGRVGGKRFLSIDAKVRSTALIDDRADFPESIRAAAEKSFVECMNFGKPVEVLE